MDYKYPYPKISGCLSNATQKIAKTLSIPATNIYIIGSEENHFVCFIDIELTVEQKATLDSIMANNPCTVPANTGTTIKIPSFYGMRKWFISQFGVEPVIWRDEETSDGSGECFYYLHFPTLTLAQKATIKNAYINSIKEV